MEEDGPDRVIMRLPNTVARLLLLSLFLLLMLGLKLLEEGEGLAFFTAFAVFFAEGVPTA